MDDATSDVVLSLQLDDLNRLLDATPQAKDQRDVPDGRLALVTYRDELAMRLGFIRDRQMGRSMARAVLQDDTALREARAQENGAIRDRLAASRLGRVRDITHPAPLIDLTDGSDDAAMTEFARVNAVTLHPDLIEPDPRPTRPIRHPRRHHPRSGASLFPPRSSLVSTTEPAQDKESLFGARKTCVACSDEVTYTSAVYAPCGHDYCKDCAKTVFVNAIRDEALFPPRCCRQPIPIAAVDVFLTPEFIKHFEEKSVEFTTPDRVYCAWPTCSAFIPPSSINGEIAVCSKCQYWVCTMCKGPTHQGRDCPQDGALNNLIETAREAGWQRCYQCRRFVELSLGCKSYDVSKMPASSSSATDPGMSRCHCGAEFCYICARRWKTCSCAQWDEQRLLNRANQIADVRHGPEMAENREAMVNEIQDGLRENHDCDHAGWRRIGQGGQCQGCEGNFRHFMYICDDCGTLACNDCRRNRL